MFAYIVAFCWGRTSGFGPIGLITSSRITFRGTPSATLSPPLRLWSIWGIGLSLKLSLGYRWEIWFRRGRFQRVASRLEHRGTKYPLYYRTSPIWSFLEECREEFHIGCLSTKESELPIRNRTAWSDLHRQARFQVLHLDGWCYSYANMPRRCWVAACNSSPFPRAATTFGCSDRDSFQRRAPLVCTHFQHRMRTRRP